MRVRRFRDPEASLGTSVPVEMLDGAGNRLAAVEPPVFQLLAEPTRRPAFENHAMPLQVSV